MDKFNGLPRYRYLFTVTLIMLSGRPLEAQVVADPGFETVSGYTYFSGPATIGCWTIDFGSGAIVNNGFGRPRSGKQVLVLPLTSKATSTTVSQIISNFVPNVSYRLSYFTSVYRNGSFTGAVNGAVSLGSGSVSFTYLADPAFSAFGTESPWFERSFDFTAPATTLRLFITAYHSGEAAFIGFDDFQLRPVSSPPDAMLTNSFACDDILEFSEPAVNDKTSHMFDSKFTLIIQRSPSVGFEFLVSATQGSYVIEASIDLINWNLVTKQPLIPDERLLIVPNISHCFYRARLFTPAPGLRLQ